MFRSRIILDRRFTRIRRSPKPATENEGKSSSEQNKKQVNDKNNNRTTISNNFDFIEPCDVIGDEINSLDSLEIKNWRYHLTNNKF